MTIWSQSNLLNINIQMQPNHDKFNLEMIYLVKKLDRYWI